MNKKVVLAEKPSVARDIARVLNCTKKGNGFIEGSEYIVTWALGHLVTLADPEAYNPKYQAWKLEDLPMLPKSMKLEVIKQTRGQYNVVKQQLLRKDVSEIIIATDAGREGELVARWIIEKSGVNKPIKRLWISSVTDKAIREGFGKLKDGKGYENLYQSAQARSVADWYVGINATRALTCKFNAQLSCGRVQTPTLGMIAKREEEIQGFIPKKYYGIQAVAKGVKLTWYDANNNSRNFDEAVLNDLIKNIKGKDLLISSLVKSIKKSFAPGLYNLTDLQRDANKIYGFSAKQTLNIMQKLYEEHKILTYPRTDSRHISEDIVETLKDRLKASAIGSFSKFAFRLTREPLRINKSFVDDTKVTDHHAIIPTEQVVMLSDLSKDEKLIYELVVKRFMAALLPAFEYEETSIVANVGKETFKAKGKVIINQGWKEIYDNFYHEENDEKIEEYEDQSLATLAKGDKLQINEYQVTKGVTSPPPLHTEGTLLTAMENPIKNSPYGIGTVATRADIIEKLLNGFLIEKKGRSLHITSKGTQLLDLVPTDLKSAELTAEWEKKLELIATGKLSKDKFINEIKDFSIGTVKEIKNSQVEFKHDNVSREKCPDCGKYMLEVNGKKGKMMVCPDRECGHRRGVSRVTNARCPVCHKKLELRGQKDQQIFVCICGHREKMSVFNERKKQSTNKADKRDVQKYLKEQHKEKTEQLSPFAEALAKLKDQL